MIGFPNAKLNLGLRILRKREDGYHDLETIFYPIALKDALEILPSTDLSIKVTGLIVNGNKDDNLCMKAYRLLKRDHTHLPPVSIHLHKTIPMGAGLGGGSADAAFTLKMLNEKFELGLSTEHLIKYALELGSDCPFFIINQPCLAKGRGEVLQKIELDLSGYSFVLVNPGIHIDTGSAFSSIEVKPLKETFNLDEIVRKPVEHWKEILKNDFEETVSSAHPIIAEIKHILYEKGAVYASMTGSGSTVFGIFSHPVDLEHSFPAAFYVKNIPVT
jgi:4-diphosphocytidyl-2-C-methyl-D-erythritol kinase